jgi:hypothetical protein
MLLLWKGWLTRTCASASPIKEWKFLHASSRHPMGCAPFRRRRSKSGGRSSRRRTSKQNELTVADTSEESALSSFPLQFLGDRRCTLFDLVAPGKQQPALLKSKVVSDRIRVAQCSLATDYRALARSDAFWFWRHYSRLGKDISCFAR